jgi:hypothetical protein
MRLHRAFLLTTALIFTSGVTGALAQTASPRFEIGAGTSVLRLTRSETTTAGVSGRMSLDITNWLAMEGEMTFFPNDDITIRNSTIDADFGIAHNRRRVDGLFGAKITHRRSRYGIFGKVRPGFTHLTNNGVQCVGEDCARILLLFRTDAYRTEFALDLGGGFEFYPSARTVARFEFGDMVIRHRSDAPPCWTEACTSHNFTTRIGGGFRF